MSLNTYSEIPNWLYLGKPVYTKEIIDSYSSVPSVQAYAVNESERSIPINVSNSASATYASASYAAPVRNNIIPLSEGRHLIKVPSVRQNRYSEIFSEEILRTYTIYSESRYPTGFERLGRLTKIEKSPGSGANLYFFGETGPYHDHSYLFYDPNEFVGKLSNAGKLGGKKTRKNKRK